MLNISISLRRSVAAAAFIGAALCISLPASAGAIYQLNATNVTFNIPSTLFTGNKITGFVEIASSVAPGGSIGNPQLQQLSFDVAGYNFTLADFQPGYDVDGRISADGKSISFLEIGYGLDPKLVPGCGGGCYGSVNVNSGDPSNLLVIGDIDFNNYGQVLFDTSFALVPPAAAPEPLSLGIFAAGLVGVGAMRRRKKA